MRLLSEASELLRSVLILLRSLHTHIVAPFVHWWEETVLGSWEELVRTLVRQGFDEATRFLNGFVAWLLSLFNHHYRDTLRKSWDNQKWWHHAHQPSTFNALVAGMKRTDTADSRTEAADGTVLEG